MSALKQSFIRDLLAGRRFRERLLRLAGAGDLYDRIEELTTALHDQHNNELGRAAVRSTIDAQAMHFQTLANSHRLIELDYPVIPRVRHGGDEPVEPRLGKLIGAGDARYAETISSFLPLVESLSKIPAKSEQPGKPHWNNGWIPAFDAVSLYAQLVLRNPPMYLEIGSGNSTKFARQAISDFDLRTKIVSIDPCPRSDVDAICDEVIRMPFEDAPTEAYSILSSTDMLFFDGSHRSFQNSDVTVFFTELLPALPNGILTGVHDILLPCDYPADWLNRHYSEQYLLACWLLAGDRLHIDLPLRHCSWRPDLGGILDPLWNHPNLVGSDTHGCAFWFTPTGNSP
jgi:hypothetical protein